ncbi:MAG: SAM-dependent methyltransferase [Methanobacteriota archaeon]
MYLRGFPKLRDQRDRLADCTRGFFTVWIVALGKRFRLLETLGASASPLPPEELAKKAHCHVEAVRRWCEAGTACGILERHGRRGYHLAPHMPLLLLDDDNRNYMTSQHVYAAMRSLRFGAFADVLGTGADHWKHADTIEEATKPDHTLFLEAGLPYFRRLTKRLEAGADVLDLGCGRGIWILRMAQQFPRSRFVGVDADAAATRHARWHMEQAGVSARVKILKRDLAKHGIEAGADLVYLGETLHTLPHPETALAAARRALRDRGRLAILEAFRPDSPGDWRRYDNPLVLALELDNALDGTRFFEKKELLRLVRDAGFRQVRQVELDGGLWLTVARA